MEDSSRSTQGKRFYISQEHKSDYLPHDFLLQRHTCLTTFELFLCELRDSTGFVNYVTGLDLRQDRLGVVTQGPPQNMFFIGASTKHVFYRGLHKTCFLSGPPQNMFFIGAFTKHVFLSGPPQNMFFIGASTKYVFVGASTKHVFYRGLHKIRFCRGLHKTCFLSGPPQNTFLSGPPQNMFFYRGLYKICF